MMSESGWAGAKGNAIPTWHFAIADRYGNAEVAEGCGGRQRRHEARIGEEGRNGLAAVVF
jgi:hypothetical protein